jgi:outer membrane protein assembly factor BamB
MDGFLYALHARNGRLRLSFQVFSPVISSPSALDDVVFLSSNRGLLYAIDGKARNWILENKVMPYWKALYIFSLAPQPPPSSGYIWSLRLGATTSSSPIVANSVIYIGSGNKLSAIDIQSQDKLWVFETRDNIRSSPALAGSVIYLASEDGSIYALDAGTGDELWDISVGSRITSSPAVTGGTVFVGSHDGNLYAID